MEHSFSIRHALHFGWTTLRARSALVFQVVLTLFAVEVAYAIVTKVLVGTAIGFIATVVLFVLAFLLSVGATRITLRLAQGKETSYGDIWPPTRLALKYLGASVLSGTLIVLPLLIFAVVAFALQGASTTSDLALIILFLLGVVAALSSAYFILRYFFVKIAIVDNTGVVESLRVSAALSAGQKWHLLLFLIVLILFNIVGAIVFLVGLLVSVPVTLLAFAHAYVQLKR